MSELWVNTFKNENGNGAPDFPNGITATGVITATVSNSTLGALTVSGDATIGGNLGVAGTVTYEDVARVDATGISTFREGFNLGPLAGIALTAYKDGSLRSTGIITATSFTGALTGNVTGNASGTAGGLSGTPNITVGRITLSGSTQTNIHTQAATAGGTTTLDMNTADNWIITLAGNTTIGDPTNEKLGQTGSIWMVQDGTGSRTAAWHSSFKWVGGTAPTLSTAASSIDRIDYIVKAAGEINAVASLDVK